MSEYKIRVDVELDLVDVLRPVRMETLWRALGETGEQHDLMAVGVDDNPSEALSLVLGRTEMADLWEVLSWSSEQGTLLEEIVSDDPGMVAETLRDGGYVSSLEEALETTHLVITRQSLEEGDLDGLSEEDQALLRGVLGSTPPDLSPLRELLDKAEQMCVRMSGLLSLFSGRGA